jgi:ABC-type lipoprotein export system ATPase subunit
MIHAERISKCYGSTKVLEGISIELDDGDILCVHGRSGCGKSTLLKILALITKQDNGKIVIDGVDVSNSGEDQIEKVRIEKISYSFQEPLLLPYLTVIDNIVEVTGAGKEYALKLLRDVGLEDRVYYYPSKLSGGEKKRVDIIRALARRRKITIADEPLSNLDPESGSKVMNLLKEFAGNKGVAIYSSVDPSAVRFANKTLDMLRNG